MSDALPDQHLMAWAARLDELDYYTLLDVARGATEADIRLAFHDFALAFHPDRHRAAPPEQAAAAQRVFQRGAEAYRALIHPVLRQRYDAELHKGRLRIMYSESPPMPPDNEPKPALEVSCRSAGAKLLARKAEKLIASGDLAGARDALLQALSHDGGANLRLTERIEALELELATTRG